MELQKFINLVECTTCQELCLALWIIKCIRHDPLPSLRALCCTENKYTYGSHCVPWKQRLRGGESKSELGIWEVVSIEVMFGSIKKNKGKGIRDENTNLWANAKAWDRGHMGKPWMFSITWGRGAMGWKVRLRDQIGTLWLHIWVSMNLTSLVLCSYAFIIAWGLNSWLIWFPAIAHPQTCSTYSCSPLNWGPHLIFSCPGKKQNKTQSHT